MGNVRRNERKSSKDLTMGAAASTLAVSQYRTVRSNSSEQLRWRGALFPWLSTFYLVLIFGVPTLVTVILRPDSICLRPFFWLLAPFVWSLAFVLIAGILSLAHQGSILVGKFQRASGDASIRPVGVT